MKVPFNDLSRIHGPLKEELDSAWRKTVDSNAFVLGPNVDTFEKNFAEYHNLTSEKVAALSTGLDALELGIRALGVKPGDEIITVANTFNATASAIRAAGAIPVLADIDPENYLMDVEQVSSLVNSKTVGVMPVHLYGQQADMSRINKLASKNGLWVLEDACQAHGTMQNGNHPGALSEGAAFSFYPGKNLGAFGDAGAIISSNNELIQKVKMLRNYGQSRRYYHDGEGFNRRMDGLQAAVLNVKLPHLDEWNKSRQNVAAEFIENLTGVGDLLLPKTMAGNTHNYHLFVIQTEDRDRLIEHLKLSGVDTGIHYPIPIHMQRAFNYLGIQEGTLPVTERASKRIISLPIFPHMGKEEVEYVAESIRKYFS